MNLDDKLKLAHEYLRDIISNWEYDSSFDPVAESWEYADAMEAEYNKRKVSTFPDAIKEESQPDWSQAPDWAKWWAVDSDGDAYFYSFKPHIKEGSDCWGAYDDTVHGGYAKIAEENCNYQGDWKDSLRERLE